ncbi:hypothetical protein E4U50_002913 [Claviceps purpurea]|nr:hypothetical protein E4U50_002913 [Claviceps purpurea]
MANKLQKISLEPRTIACSSPTTRLLLRLVSAKKCVVELVGRAVEKVDFQKAKFKQRLHSSGGKLKHWETQFSHFLGKIAASALIGNAASSAIGKSAEGWRH